MSKAHTFEVIKSKKRCLNLKNTSICTPTHTVNPSPGGVLSGEAESWFSLSLSGVNTSSPPGGISSFLILLVVELAAWRPAPLDLSTIITLTSTLQKLLLSVFPSSVIDLTPYPFVASLFFNLTEPCYPVRVLILISESRKCFRTLNLYSVF